MSEAITRKSGTDPGFCGGGAAGNFVPNGAVEGVHGVAPVVEDAFWVATVWLCHPGMHRISAADSTDTATAIPLTFSDIEAGPPKSISRRAHAASSSTPGAKLNNLSLVNGDFLCKRHYWPPLFVASGATISTANHLASMVSADKSAPQSHSMK